MYLGLNEIPLAVLSGKLRRKKCICTGKFVKGEKKKRTTENILF